MPLEIIDAILRTASTKEHPWKDLNNSDEIGESFARMVHGMADFVVAMRKHPETRGFDEARENLETIVHSFPAYADPYIPDTLEGVDLGDTSK